MILSAQDLALATSGSLRRDAPAGEVCTDTRKVRGGHWFLALKGPNFDAHDFLDQAVQAGAVGVIAERVPPNWSAGHIAVPDGLKALQDVGRFVRSSYRGPVIGITGSTGKTTTRALVALALSDRGQIHQTEGNLNNHIGLPLTILAAPVGAAAWVLELGMNHAGEIHVLQDIGKPTVRLITNIGVAHLEGLGTIEGVAKAKGELFDGARPGDILCVNMDDPRVAALPTPDGVRLIRYGSSHGCDVRLTDAAVDPNDLQTRFRIETPTGRVLGRIDSPGLHLATNACAATAIAVALRIPRDTIGPALSRYAPVGMRLRVEQAPGQIKIINDAYNANPMSMAAALRTLADIPPSANVRRIALLGDMLELGQEEIARHKDMLDLALSLKLDLIGLAGPRFAEAAGNTPGLTMAPDAKNLAHLVRDQLRPGDIVLLKASRGMAMERILQELRSDPKDIN
jgi:UDP-N-acetylmuramoyl-tripeptide--D-alanyl-D-alanine ligase